jgi:type II secretory pathway component PulF
MPAYEYWAMTEIGDTVSGKITAASPDAASHLLTLRGWTVRRLEELAEPAPPVAEPTTLSDDDFVTVADQLETITAQRLPLVASLRTLVEEAPRPRLRHAVNRVIAALDEGRSLEEALGGLRSAVPKRMAILFEHSAHAGRLPFLIQQAVEQFRMTAELRRRVIVNLTYPLILLLLAAVICGAFLLVIVPGFKKMFEDFDTSLPSLTVLLIAVSDLLVNYAVILVFALLAGGAIIAVILFRSEEANWRHSILRRIPFVGGLFRAASLSGFCRMLAVLVDSGYSLIDAFRIAAAANDDARLSASAQSITADLERGISPVDAVRVSEAFPREMLPVFRWADQKGLFIEALRGAADIYAARSQMNSGVFAVVLEPVVMFGVASTIGLILLALFLPLIKLLNDLA